MAVLLDRCRWIASALLALVLVPGVARADDAGTPLAGKKVSLGGVAGAKSAKFAFQSEKDQAPLLPEPDPTGGFELVVRGTGAGAGRSERVRVTDPALWKLLGKPTAPKGWQYKDKAGTAGGVRKIVLEKGGLKIDAKGPLWSFVPEGPQGAVQVSARIGGAWYCAEFGGEVKKDEAGRFEAKNASAPATCETHFCGNGIVDPGESCDDGNLVDNDTCGNDCAEPCVGPAYDSTFAALEGVVFTGCTDSFCHAGSMPAAELDLTAGNAYGALVGVDALEVEGLRVDPGSTATSFLYDKLQAGTNGTIPAAGQAMPLAGTPLSAQELEAVALWIEAGAPEAGTVDGTAEALGVCLP